MMGWSRWSRKAEVAPAGAPAALGIDLNGTRIRAMAIDPGRPPRTLLLDDPADELPMAVSLEKRQPEVGRPAIGLTRRSPHLGCYDFLAAIGTPNLWQVGRHRFDAAGLVGLALDRVRLACPRPENFTLSLPIYLPPSAVSALHIVAEKIKLPVRGSAILPLALLATFEPADRRPTLVLVVDVDDHAFTGTVVVSEAQQARVLTTMAQQRLNLRVWKERLLNALADRCVRICRRDPRDNAVTEQALFEQLDDALDRVRHGQKADLTIRSESWYQNLIQHADDFDGYCQALVRQAIAALRDPIGAASPVPPQAVWLTYAAGRLPGLAEGLRDYLGDRSTVSILPPDAGARAAVTLAGRWLRDELPRVHLDSSILLPDAPATDGRLPRETAVPLRQRFRSER